MNLYSQISANRRKTIIIMVFFVLFIATVAYLFGQAQGGYGASFLPLALTFSLFTSLGSYFYGDKVVLFMNGARPADKKRDFNFYTVTQNLCIAAGLPMPALYVIESEALNAFATGRDPKHAVVCATRGLLERLDRSDIEGVIAHELSHVRNFDIRLMLIVSVLVGVIAYMADFFLRSLWWGSRSRDSKNRGGGIVALFAILLAILAPILAILIQLAVSRQREYLADTSGVLLTRNPEGLADALEKIKNDSKRLETANHGTAHLFIANPFKGKDVGGWLANLFNTHPPIEERIRILRSM